MTRGDSALSVADRDHTSNSNGTVDESGLTESTPLISLEATSPSRQQIRVARTQFIALCWALFLIGWNDGTTGPLLPRILKQYDVDFAKVSYIFMAGCGGAVLGACFNMPLTDKLGFGKLITLGAFLQLISCTIQASRPGWPMFVLSFAIAGFGIAFQDAQGNGFIAGLQRSETKMGILHAAYGTGALTAPLSATQFAQSINWASHYWVSAALACTNVIILALVFRLQSQDESFREAGEIVPDEVEGESENKYSQIIRINAIHLMALFIIIYIGVEVTIGSWIVTFMMLARGGGPSSGYISTGFFGGLTLGRVILLGVNRQIGEIRAIYVYIFFATLCQLVVWLVPNLIIGSVAVTLIGVLLGPMYPIIMNHTARIIPRQLVTGTIGWIGACGAAGATVLPYFTGGIASKYGIQSLQPFTLTMMVILAIVWKITPKTPQAVEK